VAYYGYFDFVPVVFTGRNAARDKVVTGRAQVVQGSVATVLLKEGVFSFHLRPAGPDRVYAVL
jgi:hypothetical protein